MSSKKAWVTLATNDTYSLGALVLAQSLKKVNTTHDLVVFVTSSVTYAMRGALQSIFNVVKEVNILDSGDVENLQLLARPELGITFTKLHCWRLTQYEKCVFLDADTLVLQNCDELFDREELSAAPDVGWPDCFNSGVFVFKPSEETYQKLIKFALDNGSFDGGDQGLLNMFFSDWAISDSSKRLSFLYNLTSAAIYSYLPAFKWFGKGVKIIHFIGNAKPWLQPFNSVTRTVSTDSTCSHLTNFLQYWWDLFCAGVYPQLSPEMAGLANSLSQIKLEEPSPEQKAREDFLRRQNWEEGNIDYMGRDSFENILNKINQSINKLSEPESVSDDSPASIPQPSDSKTPETVTTQKTVADLEEKSVAPSLKDVPPSSPPASVAPPLVPAAVPQPSALQASSEPVPSPSVKPAATKQPSVEKPVAVEKQVTSAQPPVTKQASAEKPTASPESPPSPSAVKEQAPIESPISCPRPAPEKPVTSASAAPTDVPTSGAKPASVAKEQTPIESPVSCPKPAPQKPATPTSPTAIESPATGPKPVAPAQPKEESFQAGAKPQSVSQSAPQSAVGNEPSQKATPSRQSSTQESQGKPTQKSGGGKKK